TMVKLVPAIMLSSPTLTCDVGVLIPIWKVPGLAFSCSTRSLIEFTGSLMFPTTAEGTSAISEIGTKSLNEPAEKVRGPARREGNDERDLPRRIGLRRRERNKKHEKCRGAGDTSNMQFHVLDPSLIVLMHPCAASAGQATASRAAEQAPI